jgi:tetratricopeptide (TPR) repeat protein
MQLTRSLVTSLFHSAKRLFISLALLPALAAAAQDFSHPDGELSPQAPLIQKANDDLASGDYHGSLAILTQLNAQSPNNPQILYDLGLTLDALDTQVPAPEPASPTAPAPMSLTAESCYRQAIQASPLFAAPHVALGLLLAREDQLKEGRNELAIAVGIPEIEPPLKARALRALARLDLRSNPSTASSELIDAIHLTPEQPDDILLSAEIAEASNDLPAAEQAYRRYLALPEHTTDPGATSALVHVLLAQHHSAEAESLLTSALAQHSGDPVLTAQLADTYLSSGDPAKTAQAGPLLEKLHAAHPSDPSIGRLLARVYAETGRLDQADALYASIIAAAAGDHVDPTLLDDRADTLIRLRRPAEAEKLLKQAVANPSAFPSSSALAEAALHLAFAAEEIDDPKTCLQALALRATVQQPSPTALFLEATANDALHQSGKAAELYKQFLLAAKGQFPDQESQARKRLGELQHVK